MMKHCISFKDSDGSGSNRLLLYVMKGWSLSDLMYVIKYNAVASMTKQLDQVSAAFAATKKAFDPKNQILRWKSG